ncbi:unnamed protein product [Strongylus vulgaris]|uniref:Uncharacterized protein n=1 Tax=Strongylus vulgaris TaxID=40348 RepID=A0A3P7J0V6_STRVU|nr:unnamed protein product [Strongylus vulgaris]
MRSDMTFTVKNSHHMDNTRKRSNQVQKWVGLGDFYIPTALAQDPHERSVGSGKDKSLVTHQVKGLCPRGQQPSDRGGSCEIQQLNSRRSGERAGRGSSSGGRMFSVTAEMTTSTTIPTRSRSPS